MVTHNPELAMKYSSRISAIPIIPIEPAKEVRSVLAFFVIRLFRLKDSAVRNLMEETKVNNLEKFKKYLDDNSDLKDLTSDVQYTYATTLTFSRRATAV